VSARDEILARVRSALASAPEAAEVPRDYARRGLLTGEALLARFAERVQDYRAVVVRCTPDEVEQRIADAVAGRSVVVPAGLPWHVPGATVDDAMTAYELDDVECVVTGAAAGIAVTGTVVLDHGPDQGRRALTLVPDVHMCVVREGQVVDTVPEAVVGLDPRRPQTWISGPSATSDIELNRVEGVHGPRQLTVILVSRES
jgi:L-lactate dehydrogenase complex protein LldG